MENNLSHSNKFLKLNIDRTAEIVSCDGELLPFIYKTINCECFESVTISGHYILIVDECGKICEPVKLHNILATAIYPGSLFDYIAGDALVAKIASVNGKLDIVGLSDDEIAVFLAVLKSQKKLRGVK